MTPTVLAAKLFAPPLRPRWVPRPRLTRQLAAGLARPLTVVVAPAGYGKTTLVSEWRASPHGQETPLAWLSLDAGDNDPARLLAHLIAALAAVRPGVGASALALLRAGGPRDATADQAVLAALANELAEWRAPAAANVAAPLASNGGARHYAAPNPNGHAPAEGPPAVLALDDFHALTAPGAIQAVAFLLDHLPPNLRLLLLTRGEPPLALARLRALNALTEIRAADLSFTQAEATDFFTRVMGLALDDEQIAALGRRTEGWAAGLQLAALAVQSSAHAGGTPGAAGFVQDFAGSHRYVLDYLVEEVLRRQPPEVQAFLRVTSVLDRFSAGLCQALLAPVGGWPDASAGRGAASAQLAPSLQAGLPGDPRSFLDYLERLNLFLVPLDGCRQWYRYHHLFAEALREQLRQTGPEVERFLHLRASDWFAAQDLLEDAIRHAFAAADYERAARLIDPAADQRIRLGELRTIRRWLEALPGDIVRADPALCIWSCWTLLSSGPIDQVEGFLQAAERELAAAEAGGSLPAEARRRFSRLSGQALVIRSRLAVQQGDERAAAAFARQALTRLPRGEVSLRALVGLQLACRHLSCGEAQTADSILTAAHQALQPHYDPHLQLQVLQTLARARLLQGRLQAAHDAADRGRALAVQHHLNGLVNSFWIRLAQICLEWNDLAQAEAHLAEGFRDAERRGDGDWILLGLLVRSSLAQARGDHAAAWVDLQEALRQHQRLRGGEPTGFLAAWIGRFWLQRGDLAAAKAAFRPRSPAALDYAHEFENQVLVRFYLADGRPADALALAKTLRRGAEAAGRGLQVLRCLVLQALAHQALDQGPQARRLLEQALRQAAPEGYTRLFLDEGPPLLALLDQLPPAHAQRPAADRVLAAASVETSRLASAAIPLAASRSAPAASLLEPLSGREREILQLLAAGLTNQEIADRLVMAVSTVRWYSKQIYRKLDVHNRTQAVLRAQALGLA